MMAIVTVLLGLHLEEHTLADVQKRLGPAVIEHNGLDAGGSQFALCYTAPDGTGVAFTSSGEMGGPSHDLTGFHIAARESLLDYRDFDGEPEGTRPHCLAVASFPRALGTLRLGLSRAAVRASLRREKLSERSDSIEASTREQHPNFSTVRSLQVRFQNGRVSAIRVFQASAN